MDGVQVLQGVGRADDVAELPVDLTLYAGDVKEHVHPEGSHWQGRTKVRLKKFMFGKLVDISIKWVGGVSLVH